MYYLFLSSKNAINNLEGRMIKVSRIKKTNDLFELKPYLRFDKDKRREIEGLRKKVANTYGMACFSSYWQEPIMWGHYADRNRGIVLGFKVNPKRYDIRRVDYPKRRVRTNPNFPLDITPIDYINTVGFIKYKGWSYEREHRFFVKLDECIKIKGNNFLKLDNDLVLKKVIVGPANLYRSRNYTKTARYLIEKVKELGADLMVSRAEFGGYKIVRCGYWTPRFNKLLESI